MLINLRVIFGVGLLLLACLSTSTYAYSPRWGIVSNDLAYLCSMVQMNQEALKEPPPTEMKALINWFERGGFGSMDPIFLSEDKSCFLSRFNTPIHLIVRDGKLAGFGDVGYNGLWENGGNDDVIVLYFPEPGQQPWRIERKYGPYAFGNRFTTTELRMAVASMLGVLTFIAILSELFRRYRMRRNSTSKPVQRWHQFCKPHLEVCLILLNIFGDLVFLSYRLAQNQTLQQPELISVIYVFACKPIYLVMYYLSYGSRGPMNPSLSTVMFFILINAVIWGFAIAGIIRLIRKLLFLKSSGIVPA